MKRAALVVMVVGAAFRCSTIAENAGGDSNLPSAGVGPFRKLSGAEVNGTAPFVLDDQTADYRQPCALALDESTGAVALYVVMASQGHDVIARTRAADGRTFYGATTDIGHKPQQVLASDQTWEGPDLARPSAIAVSGGVWLYYTTNGSVGLAKSSDGLAFTKVGTPVLAADATGPITSASVAALPDGTFDMMFTVGDSIYEATSIDGTAFARAPGPVLAPAPPKTDLAPGEIPPFDTESVGEPLLVPRTTAADRLQIRVLYTGHAQGASSAIGFAARYGTTGPLVRADGAVYAVGKNESAPALFEGTFTSADAGTVTGSLLYVEQDQTASSGAYRAIASGFSPPPLVLPAADRDFPSSP